MGTDIHGIWQKYEDGKWKDIPSNYKQERDYNLFAVLANVRNGYGFAGIPTGEAVEPISIPRGLPEDFDIEMEEGEKTHVVYDISIIGKGYLASYIKEFPYNFWMGYHDFSWLSGEEMLKWYKTPHTKVHYGILDRDVYENWDKKSGYPSGWCGDIEGPNIIKIEETVEDMKNFPNWTHIYCDWKTSLNDDLSYFFDEVQRLVDEHGKIRFVFGFDS